MSQEYDTRESAFMHGATHYRTGEPCRRGHLSVRYTSTGACRDCVLHLKRKYHDHLVELAKKFKREKKKNRKLDHITEQ